MALTLDFLRIRIGQKNCGRLTQIRKSEVETANEHEYTRIKNRTCHSRLFASIGGKFFHP